MKVKYADKVYEVLYTENRFGVTFYAIEDEPNHIDFVHNVEIVKSQPLPIYNPKAAIL